MTIEDKHWGVGIATMRAPEEKAKNDEWRQALDAVEFNQFHGPVTSQDGKKWIIVKDGVAFESTDDMKNWKPVK